MKTITKKNKQARLKNIWDGNQVKKQGHWKRGLDERRRLEHLEGKVQTDSKETSELDVVGKPVVSVSGSLRQEHSKLEASMEYKQTLIQNSNSHGTNEQSQHYNHLWPQVLRPCYMHITSFNLFFLLLFETGFYVAQANLKFIM